PSLSEYSPPLATRLPPSPAPLSTMLTTPAIASEPYCAEAPSRSTSTRSIAATGMALRSTAEEPRPIVPLTLTRAETWRRLPLTRISTWSGDRPRSCAGRPPLGPSAMAGGGQFSDGRARARAVASPGVPVGCRASGVMMSSGDCDSATVRSATRVPVTITVSRVLACTGASWPQAGADRVAAMARASGEMARKDMLTCSGLRLQETPAGEGSSGDDDRICQDAWHLDR